MEENQKKFIERLVTFRKQQKISQAKLAELCDVSNGTIGNIECGVTKPSFDLIFRLADSLNIQAKDLFDFEKEIKVDENFSEYQQLKIQEMINQAVQESLTNVQKSVSNSMKKFNIEHTKKEN